MATEKSFCKPIEACFNLFVGHKGCPSCILDVQFRFVIQVGRDVVVEIAVELLKVVAS